MVAAARVARVANKGVVTLTILRRKHLSGSGSLPSGAPEVKGTRGLVLGSTEELVSSSSSHDEGFSWNKGYVAKGQAQMS